MWSRSLFALRSVTVTCAGFETLIRTATVVFFFSSIRFEPATENASRVCGAVVPRETTRSIGLDASASRMPAGSTTVPGGALVAVVSPTVPTAEAGCAERRGRFAERLAGDRGHGSERGRCGR